MLSFYHGVMKINAVLPEPWCLMQHIGSQAEKGSDVGRVFLSGDKLVCIQVNTLPLERHATPGKLLNLEWCCYLSHGPFGKSKRVRTHLAGGSAHGTPSMFLRLVVITGWVSFHRDWVFEKP